MIVTRRHVRGVHPILKREAGIFLIYSDDSCSVHASHCVNRQRRDEEMVVRPSTEKESPHAGAFVQLEVRVWKPVLVQGN